MAKLMKFTKVCGLFRVLMLQAKKQSVPQKNTTIFQGYTLGPIAFKLCPVIIKGAPVHCRTSLISNFFIANIICSIFLFVNQNFHLLLRQVECIILV
jgi:hypothetical protein